MKYFTYDVNLSESGTRWELSKDNEVIACVPKSKAEDELEAAELFEYLGQMPDLNDGSDWQRGIGCAGDGRDF